MFSYTTVLKNSFIYVFVIYQEHLSSKLVLIDNIQYMSKILTIATRRGVCEERTITLHGFVWLYGVYRPTREFFTHVETLKGCKFWPMLGSYGSLTYHTHCDTGLPFIMVISEDPWHSHIMPSIWQYVFCDYFTMLALKRIIVFLTPNI